MQDLTNNINTKTENPANTNKNNQKYLKLKNIFNFLFVSVFFVGITVFGILFFVIPKKEVSVLEQRKLTQFPEVSVENVWSGKFTADFNIYFSDNVAFRDQLVKTKFVLDEAKGLRFDDVKIYDSKKTENVKNESVTKTKKDDISPVFAVKKIENPVSMEKIDLENPYYKESGKHFDIFDIPDFNDKFSDYMNIDKDELEGEQRGGLFVVGDTALEIFYGNEKVSEDYARTINTYAEALGNTVRVYNLIIPNHFEFGLPEKYKGKVGRAQRPFMDIVKENLNDSVIFVDIYDTMKEHYEKGEYLYFRSDHHWTGLGAYRAYEKFCESAGFTPVPLENYETRRTTGFLGTLYSSSLDKNIKNNPDYVDYYVTDLPYEQTNTTKEKTTYKGSLVSERWDGKTNGYLTFMGGDIPLATIKTENDNGRSIIVFKESYGNAFAPFLVPHYETVYVADIRAFPYNAVNFIKENGITDVLFINNIMASNTSARIANILNLMQQ